jgi:hypothetical protein
LPGALLAIKYKKIILYFLNKKLEKNIEIAKEANIKSINIKVDEKTFAASAAKYGFKRKESGIYIKNLPISVIGRT